METLTTQAAAERLGVSVPKFHHLVSKHNVGHAMQAPGLRGAKFWNPADIDRLADLIEAVSQ